MSQRASKRLDEAQLWFEAGAYKRAASILQKEREKAESRGDRATLDVVDDRIGRMRARLSAEALDEFERELKPERTTTPPRSRERAAPANGTAPGNLSGQVREWLTAEGLAVELLRNPEFAFTFRVCQPPNVDEKLVVSQAEGEDKVVIAAGIQLEENDQARLSNLPSEDQNALMRDLGWLLHSRGVSFQVDDRDGVLNRIALFSAVYADALTKDRLMTAVADMYRTQALVLLQLSEYVDRTLSRRSPARSQKPVAGVQAAPRRALRQATAAAPTASALVCASCGRPVTSGDAFCGSCGQPVARPPGP